MMLARSAQDLAMEAALDLVEVPALFVDPSLRVRAWNGAAERVLQFRRAEVIGAPCLGAVRSAPCMAGCPLIAGSGGGCGSVEVFRKDGTALTFHRSGRVLRGADDQLLGIVESLRPVPSAPSGAEVRFGSLSSQAPPMRRVLEQARRVARTNTAVLITGETGSGKRRLAMELHAQGPRADRPFVHVRCAPTSEMHWSALMASAQGGTLFLDHVERLSPCQQAGLELHWPEAGTPTVVTTASLDLTERVAAGTFGRSLFYRLRVIHMQLPPLRERREDILPLAHRFLQEASGPEGLSSEVDRLLIKYRWPGNIRELRNAIQHSTAVGEGDTVTPVALPDELARRPGLGVSGRSGDGELAARVRWALDRSGGHVGRAARLLGMSRSTFWRLRRDLGPTTP